MQHWHYPLLPEYYLGEDIKPDEVNTGVGKSVNARRIHRLAYAIQFK